MIEAIEVSTGSTSSQSMYFSGTRTWRLRATVRSPPSTPEPAQQAGRADVDRHEMERAVDLVEAEVVDPDHLAPVDVDDLLVHQV